LRLGALLVLVILSLLLLIIKIKLQFYMSLSVWPGVVEVCVCYVLMDILIGVFLAASRNVQYTPASTGTTTGVSVLLAD